MFRDLGRVEIQIHLVYANLFAQTTTPRPALISTQPWVRRGLGRALLLLLLATTVTTRTAACIVSSSLKKNYKKMTNKNEKLYRYKHVRCEFDRLSG